MLLEIVFRRHEFQFWRRFEIQPYICMEICTGPAWELRAKPSNSRGGSVDTSRQQSCKHQLKQRNKSN